MFIEKILVIPTFHFIYHQALFYLWPRRGQIQLILVIEKKIHRVWFTFCEMFQSLEFHSSHLIIRYDSYNSILTLLWSHIQQLLWIDCYTVIYNIFLNHRLFLKLSRDMSPFQNWWLRRITLIIVSIRN